MDIQVPREKMYTSALATIDYIKTKHPEAKRLFLLGTPSMIAEFEAAGFESAPSTEGDIPDMLVVAFDMTLQYDRLCHAAWLATQKYPPTWQQIQTVSARQIKPKCWWTADPSANVSNTPPDVNPTLSWENPTPVC